MSNLDLGFNLLSLDVSSLPPDAPRYDDDFSVNDGLPIRFLPIYIFIKYYFNIIQASNTYIYIIDYIGKDWRRTRIP